MKNGLHARIRRSNGPFQSGEVVDLGVVELPADHRGRARGSKYEALLATLDVGHGSEIDRCPQTVREAVKRYEAQAAGTAFKVYARRGGRWARVVRVK